MQKLNTVNSFSNVSYMKFWLYSNDFDKLTVKLFDRSIPEWGIKIRENFDPILQNSKQKAVLSKKKIVYM